MKWSMFSHETFHWRASRTTIEPKNNRIRGWVTLRFDKPIMKWLCIFPTVQKYLISGSGILYQCNFLSSRQFYFGRNEIGNAQEENSRGGSLFKTFVLTVLEFRVKNVSNRKRSNSSFELFRIPKIPNDTKFKSLFLFVPIKPFRTLWIQLGPIL